RFNDDLLPSTKLTRKDDCAKVCQDKSSWRTRVCGWMYQVVDSHSLDRELVYIGMSYLDRYLSKHPLTTLNHDYQLVSMTSLYLAIKIYRANGKSAAVASFVKLSNGLFTENDFVNMEKRMLDTLQWRMHPPTPQSYLELLILFIPRAACSPSTRRALFERIKFLLELSVTVQFFIGKKPSSIAVAAFVEVMEHDQRPNNVQKQSCHAHFRYCARSIAGIYCDSPEVMECRDAMKVVLNTNAWHQMDGEVMNEREDMGSPVVSEKHVPVVTP
ncbi:hypothetical protein ACHAXR_007663, partial [Thalassiosira sp. AJA248-18]